MFTLSGGVVGEGGPTVCTSGEPAAWSRPDIEATDSPASEVEHGEGKGESEDRSREISGDSGVVEGHPASEAGQPEDRSRSGPEGSIPWKVEERPAPEAGHPASDVRSRLWSELPPPLGAGALFFHWRGRAWRGSS